MSKELDKGVIDAALHGCNVEDVINLAVSVVTSIINAIPEDDRKKVLVADIKAELDNAAANGSVKEYNH